MSVDKKELIWYRSLVKLYPKSYRQDFESEMLVTFRYMLKETRTTADRHHLIRRMLKDFIISLLRETYYAAGASFNSVPKNIKRNLLVGFAFVLPFCMVFIYNRISLSLRHAVPLAGVENHTWILYSMVLPIAGVTVTAITCIETIYSEVLHAQWQNAFRSVKQNWLLAGIVTGIIAGVAIF